MNPLLTALVQAGLTTQDEANRLDRMMDSEAAREYAEQQMLLSFRAGLSAQRDRLIDAVRANDGLLTATQQNRLWAGENDRLWASVRDTILDVASERAVVAAIDAGADDAMWSLINEQMVDWAENYYTSPAAANVGSIPNLNQTSRQRVGQAVADWQRGLLPAQRMDGLPDLIRDLESTFGRARAEAIAVTETTRIFTEGIRAAEAENPFTTQWEWLTAADELVCPICVPRNGARIAKTANGFAGPNDALVTFPPAHVRCRCQVIALTDAAADGLPAVVREAVTVTPVAEPVEQLIVPRFDSIEQARQYARDTLGVNADFTGATLDQAQAINDGVADVQNIYGGSGGRPQAIRFRDDHSAVASWNGAEIIVSPKYFTNEKMAELSKLDTPEDLIKRLGRAQRRVAAAANDPSGYTAEQRQFFDDTVRELEKQLADFNPIPFGRSKNMRDVIVHELGHAIESDLAAGEFPDITGFLPPSKLHELGLRYEDSLQARLEKVARNEGTKISEYAATDGDEYLAESFLSFVRNEHDKINPELLSLFKEITR